jgi:hypothetical protein
MNHRYRVCCAPEGAGLPGGEAVTPVKPIAPIPARPDHAVPGMLDLSPYYNTALDDDVHGKPGNTLATLPHGVHAFAGVPFDVRGLTQLLGSHSAVTTHLAFPPSILGIPVNQAGSALHFLHASAWSTALDTPIGKYLVHYADGQTGSIPLLYGRNIADWWFAAQDPLPTDAQVGWAGENPRTRDMGFGVRVYVLTWQNPRPDATILSLDLISAVADAAPMLLAVTVTSIPDTTE